METPKARAIMQEYLRTHKTDSYFPAYIARRHNNHHVLMEVAEEVKKQGYGCYCSKDLYDCQTTDFIYAIKGDRCVLFGFKEVPYEWYIYSDHYPGLTAGLVGEHGYDYPFDIEDILSKVGPNRFGKDKFDSPFYIKL